MKITIDKNTGVPKFQLEDKDLKDAHTISDIRKSYGVNEGRFHMTSIDEY